MSRYDTREKKAEHAARTRAWNAKNRDKIHKTNQKQYWKNHTRNLAYSRAYYKTHKKDSIKYQKRYRAKFSEKCLVSKAKYYVRNKDKLTEYKRKWCSRNPAKVASNSRFRQARKRKLTPKSASRKRILQFYLSARRVSDCLGISFHVDHIKPLILGGKHHQNNLQVIPYNLNIRKFTKILPRWADNPSAYFRTY